MRAARLQSCPWHSGAFHPWHLLAARPRHPVCPSSGPQALAPSSQPSRRDSFTPANTHGRDRPPTAAWARGYRAALKEFPRDCRRQTRNCNTNPSSVGQAHTQAWGEGRLPGEAASGVGPGGFLGDQTVKRPEVRGRPGFDPCLAEDPAGKGKATPPSIPTWRVPWTVEPGGLSSWGREELDKTERPST